MKGLFRVIYSIICLVSIFTFSWYVPIALLIIGMLVFDFKEALIYGFIMDLTYGLGKPVYFHLFFLFSTFFLYITFFKLKKVIRK